MMPTTRANYYYGANTIIYTYLEPFIDDYGEWVCAKAIIHTYLCHFVKVSLAWMWANAIIHTYLEPFVEDSGEWICAKAIIHTYL